METRILITSGASGVRLSMLNNFLHISICFYFIAAPTKKLSIINGMLPIKSNWYYMIKTHYLFCFIKRFFNNKFKRANITNKVTFFSNKALLLICKYCFRPFNNLRPILGIVPVLVSTLKNSSIVIFGRIRAVALSRAKRSWMSSFVWYIYGTFFTYKKIRILSIVGCSFHVSMDIMSEIKRQSR